jgi:hypothetical protein
MGESYGISVNDIQNSTTVRTLIFLATSNYIQIFETPILTKMGTINFKDHITSLSRLGKRLIVLG